MQLATRAGTSGTTGQKCGGNPLVCAVSARAAGAGSRSLVRALPDGTPLASRPARAQSGALRRVGPSSACPFRPADRHRRGKRPIPRQSDSRAIGGVALLLTPFVARGCAYIAGCGGFTLRRCRSRATASRSAKSDRFAIAQRPVSRQDSVGTAMLYVQA